MGERHTGREGAPPPRAPRGQGADAAGGHDDGTGRDPVRTFAAVVLAAGSGLYIYLWGLSVPIYVVMAGLLAWLGATVVMWRRLRAGDSDALAVPVVLVVAWQLLVWAGMLVLGWAP